MYQIHAKHKCDIQPKFELEKFLTGGRIFLSYKAAQDFKKKIQKTTDSFTYKVVKLKD